MAASIPWNRIIFFVLICLEVPLSMAQSGPVCGKLLAFDRESSINSTERNTFCFPVNLNQTPVSFSLDKTVYTKGTAQSTESGPFDAACSTADLYLGVAGECGYKDTDGNLITGTTICDPDIYRQGEIENPLYNPSYGSQPPRWKVGRATGRLVHPAGTTPGFMICERTEATPVIGGEIVGTCPPSPCRPRNYCSQWCIGVVPICMDTVTCPCPNDRPTCEPTSAGPLPVCHGQCTPIVLDPFKKGFGLTSIADGVKFRVTVNGPLAQMSWTDPSRRNGWLVLDRNGNGTIDDFTELFGNLTAQPENNSPNGFLALAVFDEPANGGNGNEAIDVGDAVYGYLRVWIDSNHNGVSEASELHALQALGIFKIGLKYYKSPFIDGFGNEFRYRAKVWNEFSQGSDICYDVVLQMAALLRDAQ